MPQLFLEHFLLQAVLFSLAYVVVIGLFKFFLFSSQKPSYAKRILTEAAVNSLSESEKEKTHNIL